ncbi:MAG: hypothetical protein EG823_05895 [Actinobacteria bacterium]|nr:hypothetical protein [Actinomycetota bacterium]
MIKPSEFQIVLLAVTLLPLIWWMYRGIEWPEKPWLASALVALLAAYAATVLEGFFAQTTINAIEHVLFLVAGVCFAIASTGFLRRRPSNEDVV